MSASAVIRLDNVIADNVEIANTFFRRLTGLIPQKTLDDGSGLILRPCKQVHTYFMNYSIDVIFLTKENQIVYMQSDMKPNSVSCFVKYANSALELPAGTIDKCSLKIGDVVDILFDR